MMLISHLLAVIAAYGLGVAATADLFTRDAVSTCLQISKSISSASTVIYAPDPRFVTDTYHYCGSASQVPACVLEVGSVHDTAIAIKIIGSTTTPFAVKSGGHSCNPGFSSTPGVHIAMTRFNQVTFSSDKSTVEIGMGLAWTDVYQRLQGSGYNVVGGRVQGPGVGGFTLGGGFSWKTNQFGLTCDTVKSYTLVLPNGTISHVDSSQPDLYFALKGGLNRFGIVTSAKYYTHNQVPTVYGGLASYDSSQASAVLNATAQFSQSNTNPKAVVISSLVSSTNGTSPLTLFYYDGPTRPASFAPFDNIATVASTVAPQSFASFVNNFPASTSAGIRGYFDTISTSGYTATFLAAVKNESDFWTSQLPLHGGTSLTYGIEPFLDSYGSLATDSAFPHSNAPRPMSIMFEWASAADDHFWTSAQQSSKNTLKNAAIKEGLYVPISYPNYAIIGTTARQLYGQNAARLSAIRKRVDPANVMELAGGYFF